MSNAITGSVALTDLKSDLTQLSTTLHDVFDLMNADMSKVGDAWQDGKYQEFVDGYMPQIQKCEDISVRYSEWCKRVLDPTIENVIAVEKTDVGSGSGSIGGVGAAGAVSGGLSSSVSGGKFNGFYMKNDKPKKMTTKAVPISNGCGTETDPKSFIFAKAGQTVDTAGSIVKKKGKIGLLSKSEWEKEWKAQSASCDQHDKDYYSGVPKEKADTDFQQRSPIMGTAVKMAKGTSTKSYNEAQKDRKNSQRLQPLYEAEHQQPLNADYRVDINEDTISESRT